MPKSASRVYTQRGILDGDSPPLPHRCQKAHLGCTHGTRVLTRPSSSAAFPLLAGRRQLNAVRKSILCVHAWCTFWQRQLPSVGPTCRTRVQVPGLPIVPGIKFGPRLSGGWNAPSPDFQARIPRSVGVRSAPFFDLAKLRMKTRTAKGEDTAGHPGRGVARGRGKVATVGTLAVTEGLATQRGREG